MHKSNERAYNNIKKRERENKNENSVEIIESEDNEILPDDIAGENIESDKGNETDKNNSANKEDETNKDKNEVLENWNDTNAPMLIPIPTDKDYENSDIIPFLDEDTGLFGYRDKNNEIAIKPTFKKAGVFYSELAPVQLKENGKVGFINKEGKIVKNPFVDYIHWADTDKGVMMVQVGNNYGATSLNGEIIVDIKCSTEEEVLAKLGL